MNSNSSIEDKEDVMVFWDYETSAPPRSAAGAISTYEMVKNIRSAVAPYGPLKSIRLYWDYDSHPIPSATLRTRSELSASGVAVIDCPAEGRNGAATKKMLVDMIFHAWDSPFPFTVVVITGDRDLAYALAMLQMKAFRVVLISPAGSHSDLTSQASVQLDWSRTVLGISGGSNDLFQTESRNQIPSSTRVPTSSNSSRPGEETPLRSDIPASHNSPGLSHKPPAFSSALDRGFKVRRFPSANPSVELGDGPLSHPTSQKPLHSRSESPPDFMKATPYVKKGKSVILGPDCVELRSGNGLPSTSVFEPFNDDDDDDDDKRLSIPLPSPCKPVTRKSSSSSSSKSGQSKLSFELISKPADANASEPSMPPEEPTRLSNDTQTVITPSLPVARQTDMLPKPTPVVVPLPLSTKPPPQLPPKWIPLIETLQKHGGVLPKSTIEHELLSHCPDAFQIAGRSKLKSYLKAAVAAAIVVKYEGSCGTAEIYLRLPYRK